MNDDDNHNGDDNSDNKSSSDTLEKNCAARWARHNTLFKTLLASSAGSLAPSLLKCTISI